MESKRSELLVYHFHMWYVNQYLSINIAPPAFFQMDNGSEFTMLDAYATALPSNVVRSIPNIPQSNALVERSIGKVKHVISTWTSMARDQHGSKQQHPNATGNPWGCQRRKHRNPSKYPVCRNEQKQAPSIAPCQSHSPDLPRKWVQTKPGYPKKRTGSSFEDTQNTPPCGSCK